MGLNLSLIRGMRSPRCDLRLNIWDNAFSKAAIKKEHKLYLPLLTLLLSQLNLPIICVGVFIFISFLEVVIKYIDL